MGMLLSYHKGYRPEAEKPAEEKPPAKRTRKAKTEAPAPVVADQPTEGGSDSE